MKRPIIHPLAAAILGFALAPLLPALILFLCFLIVEPKLIGEPELAEYAVFWVVAYYSFAEMFAIFIGIPALFVMRYLWKITFATTLFAGFLIGVLGGYLMSDGINMTLLYGIYGLSTAFVFWNIWQLRIGHPMHTGRK